jgi:hypothetical protein
MLWEILPTVGMLFSLIRGFIGSLTTIPSLTTASEWKLFLPLPSTLGEFPGRKTINVGVAIRMEVFILYVFLLLLNAGS